jgi:hypothetical protein
MNERMSESDVVQKDHPPQQQIDTVSVVTRTAYKVLVQVRLVDLGNCDRNYEKFVDHAALQSRPEIGVILIIQYRTELTHL